MSNNAQRNLARSSPRRSPKKKGRSLFKIATPKEYMALLLFKKQDQTPEGKASLEEALGKLSSNELKSLKRRAPAFRYKKMEGSGEWPQFDGILKSLILERYHGSDALAAHFGPKKLVTMILSRISNGEALQRSK